MILNENTIKGKWLEIKGQIQKAWGNLTNDELDRTNGDMMQIAGLIQKKYGETQDSHSKKLTEIYKSFEDKKDEASDKIKSALKN
jgi:uncharacterized protein YjbJ (UPF0337 family)